MLPLRWTMSAMRKPSVGEGTAWINGNSARGDERSVMSSTTRTTKREGQGRRGRGRSGRGGQPASEPTVRPAHTLTVQRLGDCPPPHRKSSRPGRGDVEK